MKKSNKLLIFWLFFVLLGLSVVLTHPSKLAYFLTLIFFFIAVMFKDVFDFINKDAEPVSEILNNSIMTKTILFVYFLLVIVLFVFFEKKPNSPVSGFLILIAPFLFLMIISQIRLFYRYRKNGK